MDLRDPDVLSNHKTPDSLSDPLFPHTKRTTIAHAEMTLVLEDDQVVHDLLDRHGRVHPSDLVDIYLLLVPESLVDTVHILSQVLQTMSSQEQITRSGQNRSKSVVKQKICRGLWAHLASIPL